MQNHRITLHVFVLIVVAFLSSCGGNKNLTQYMSANEHFAFAMKFFKAKKYIRASEEFLAITYKHSGSEFSDDAQFYLAESYYNQDDHISATAEYERLVSNFPRSTFVEESMYKIVYCYYKLSPDFGLDQKFTREALHAAQNFLELYLNSPRKDEVQKIFNELKGKLAMKVYRSAHIYRKLGEWESAVIYYGKVISDYPDSRHVSSARYWKGYCYYKQDYYQKARLLFDELKRKHPNAKELIKDADEILETILKKEQKKNRDLVARP